MFPDDDAIEEHLALWAARRIWPDRKDVWRQISSRSRVMAVYDGDHLLAVMIYHNWDPKAGIIEISGAGESPRWLTRPVLKAMYAYPFALLGCQMVVQRNSERNTRLNSMLERLGFTGHVIKRLRGPDEAEIVFTLTRENWERNPIYGHVQQG